MHGVFDGVAKTAHRQRAMLDRLALGAWLQGAEQEGRLLAALQGHAGGAGLAWRNQAALHARCLELARALGLSARQRAASTRAPLIPTLLPSPYRGFCDRRGTDKPTVLDMRNWLRLKPSAIIGSASRDAARSGSTGRVPLPGHRPAWAAAGCARTPAGIHRRPRASPSVLSACPGVAWAQVGNGARPCGCSPAHQGHRSAPTAHLRPRHLFERAALAAMQRIDDGMRIADALTLAVRDAAGLGRIAVTCELAGLRHGDLEEAPAVHPPLAACTPVRAHRPVEWRATRSMAASPARPDAPSRAGHARPPAGAPTHASLV